jgi:hypothetical protein
VVKKEPVRTVGSHSACWTMVEVDSLTITASDGRTSLSAAWASGGVSGLLGVDGSLRSHANGTGATRPAGAAATFSINRSITSFASPSMLSPDAA